MKKLKNAQLLNFGTAVVAVLVFGLLAWLVTGAPLGEERGKTILLWVWGVFTVLDILDWILGWIIKRWEGAR